MSLARAAIKAWPRHELATRQQINALRRGYIRAREILGSKYLLSTPVPRKQAGSADGVVLAVVSLASILLWGLV